jgi:hydroxymethylbilane synthase
MRIGSRGSPLALAQARLVAAQLPDAEIVTITTSGDRGNGGGAGPGDAGGSPGGEGGSPGGRGGSPGGGGGGPGGEEGGPVGGEGMDKSRWVDAIEDSLLAGEIDLAVHSAKDLPGELAPGLQLLGGPARAAVEDVLCGASALDSLPAGARVGTSSIRRGAQLRAMREDLEVVELAGNVDTRLRKLADGGLDAIVLARAGLQRLDREDAIGAVLDPERFVPAPGQGMLALEARVEDARGGDARVGEARVGEARVGNAYGGDTHMRDAVAGILDQDSSACLLAERAVARALDASCNTPLGAHATPAGCGCLLLRAWVGLPDGSAWVADELLGGFYEPEYLGERMAERMLGAGAGGLLSRAQEIAAGA